MSVLVVSGTGTGVGKTVVTAALAALAATRGATVAVGGQAADASRAVVQVEGRHPAAPGGRGG